MLLSRHDSHLSDLAPPKSKFIAEHVPDMTGANAGIGKETARVLLTKNAKVWIGCRDVSKGEATIKDLNDRTGREAHILKLNLFNLRFIKESAGDFPKKETQLHVLFNNAPLVCVGMGLPVERFGTNVLGHFYLTKLLLLSTANQSKTGNIVFSAELHHWYRDQGLVSTSLHPGIIRSELQGGFAQWIFARHTFSARQSSDIHTLVMHRTLLRTSPDVVGLGGQYFNPWARVGPQIGKKLWTYMEKAANL
ncbi:NAD(P)-binding protein [Pisolithus microcarpus]|nr:NAD(P)-binding protein [Pisolithus microcarpus]